MGSYMRGGGHVQPSHSAALWSCTALAQSCSLTWSRATDATECLRAVCSRSRAALGSDGPDEAAIGADKGGRASDRLARLCARQIRLPHLVPARLPNATSERGRLRRKGAREKKHGRGAGELCAYANAGRRRIGQRGRRARRSCAKGHRGNGAVGLGGTQPLLGGFASCNFQSRAAVFVLASSPVDGRRAARELIHHGGRPRQSA